MYSVKESLNQMWNPDGYRFKTTGTHTPATGEKWVSLECDTDTQFSAVSASGDNVPDATRIEGRMLVSLAGFTSITITSGRLVIGYERT